MNFRLSTTLVHKRHRSLAFSAQLASRWCRIYVTAAVLQSVSHILRSAREGSGCRGDSSTVVAAALLFAIRRVRNEVFRRTYIDHQRRSHYRRVILQRGGASATAAAEPKFGASDAPQPPARGRGGRAARRAAARAAAAAARRAAPGAVAAAACTATSFAATSR